MTAGDKRASEGDAIYPRRFQFSQEGSADDPYLGDEGIQKLLGFFDRKGLAALKDEDRREQWYEDWLNYQAQQTLYASLLSPKRYSTRGFEFDLLRLTRFLEVFGYCSPAHGYSLQVTFLGLFPILMGSQEALKREAVATLESGGLFAFGVSEKEHGSDLLGGEFTMRQAGGRWIASGKKYYIGNSNCASIISVLARKEDQRTAERGRRTPLALLALRPSSSPGYQNVRKIHTFGVRQAFVGELEVKDHDVAPADVFAEGRQAWDAVLGTVTLGKFFLGFGSIGICEHALGEAVAHLSQRILYGKPAIEMPHLRTLLSQAYARLAAMKLFAYRALDYVQAACADDRRYLLYCAVQKAKVSTEGVKTMALLLECIGAKGFEAATWFEMALRDIQLIPGLEGSTHINLDQSAQFMSQYFTGALAGPSSPPSLLAGSAKRTENPYLMEARAGGVNSIAFADPLEAYRPLMSIPAIRLFAGQVQAFSLFVRRDATAKAILDDDEGALLMGKCLATIAYAQLIAENSSLWSAAPEIVGAIFQLLLTDMTTSLLTLASSPLVDNQASALLQKLIATPRTEKRDWDHVFQRMMRIAS